MNTNAFAGISFGDAAALQTLIDEGSTKLLGVYGDGDSTPGAERGW